VQHSSEDGEDGEHDSVLGRKLAFCHFSMWPMGIVTIVTIVTKFNSTRYLSVFRGATLSALRGLSRNVSIASRL
jgi:hypothetical protein